MKTPLPSSGSLASVAATGLTSSGKTEIAKVPVWFTTKHEHRGVQYKKNQAASLKPEDVSKLEKLGKISITKPEGNDA